MRLNIRSKASQLMKILRKRKVLLGLLSIAIVLLAVSETLRPVLFLLLLAVVVGWLVTIPLWLMLRYKPSLQTSVHTNQRIRWMMIGIVLLLAVLFSFGWFTFLRSYLDVIFYSAIITDPFPGPFGQYRPQLPTPYEIVERYGNLMTKELWFRQVVFPPFQKSCYSSEEVCQSVDDMVEIYDYYSHLNWSEYLTTIGISLLLSFPGVLFTWRYTRSPEDESQIKTLKME